MFGKNALLNDFLSIFVELSTSCEITVGSSEFKDFFGILSSKRLISPKSMKRSFEQCQEACQNILPKL
jgi:hypothetical protein